MPTNVPKTLCQTNTIIAEKQVARQRENTRFLLLYITSNYVTCSKQIKYQDSAMFKQIFSRSRRHIQFARLHIR